jgi:hypothetical protein
MRTLLVRAEAGQLTTVALTIRLVEATNKHWPHRTPALRGK